MNKRNEKGEGAKRNPRAQHSHVTLLVSLDCQNAFDRAPPLHIVKKIRDSLGLHYEANWVAEFLTNRKLIVKENRVMSTPKDLDIGVPQGSILGPLLWSILIDELIWDLEKICRSISFPGEVSLPEIFADDINFIIRGFNPSSMIRKANLLMFGVRKWSRKHNIPMAKLSAIWITKSHIINAAIKKAVDKAIENDKKNNISNIFDNTTNEEYLKEEREETSEDENEEAQNTNNNNNTRNINVNNQQTKSNNTSLASDFERFCGRKIIFDTNVWCYANVGSMRLLGVHFDSNFNFNEHVRLLLAKCKSMLYWLEGMKRTIPAEKIKMLYEGLVLSRIMFAVDVYFPYISAKNRNELEKIHAHGCRIITGMMRSVHSMSTMAECGYKPLRFMIEETTHKTANALAHYTDPSPILSPRHPALVTMHFGMNFLLKLFYNVPLPTASLRPKIAAGPNNNNITSIPKSIFPEQVSSNKFSLHHCSDATPYRMDGKPARAAREAHFCSVRDVWMFFIRKDKLKRMTRTFPHPYPPHELAIFHKNINFITSPPGGLAKPEGDPQSWPREEYMKLRKANLARLRLIEKQTDDSAICAFADASRCEKDYGSCAGAWAMYDGWRHNNKSAIFAEGEVKCGQYACTYSGESNTLLHLLQYCLANVQTLSKKSKFINIFLDAQSIMSCCEKLWVRNMNQVEQQISKNLYKLANLYKFTITIAFIFSHCGTLGNDHVDKKANEARMQIGKLPPDGGYQHYDTFRFLRNKLHLKYLNNILTNHINNFRFKSMDEVDYFKKHLIQKCYPYQPMQRIMSPHLPRETFITRNDETRLYYARIGMFPEIGGAYVKEDLDPCPLCTKECAIGRNGHTITHLFESCDVLEWCRKDKKGNKINLKILLWSEPVFSIFLLRFIFKIFSFTLKNEINVKLLGEKVKKEFVPFIFSFLHQETKNLNFENDKNENQQKTSEDQFIKSHASAKFSFENFVRCTFSLQNYPESGSQTPSSEQDNLVD